MVFERVWLLGFFNVILIYMKFVVVRVGFEVFDRVIFFFLLNVSWREDFV